MVMGENGSGGSVNVDGSAGGSFVFMSHAIIWLCQQNMIPSLESNFYSLTLSHYTIISAMNINITALGHPVVD